LTSHQKSILRDGIQHGKAPREIRRDVNMATPDDIISNMLLKMLDIINIRKTGPRAHTV
jgi:hypothetical protein